VDSLRCGRCNAIRETTDNFCRRCGHQLTVNLPAVRDETMPVPATKGLPPSLIGSVAVLAVGTGLEWLARRMAGNAARAAGRALVPSERASPATPRNAQAEAPEVTIDEVVYVRKVQVRR
jgi:hypothetical protein